VTYKSFEQLGFRWFCLKCKDNVGLLLNKESAIVKEMKNLCERMSNVEKAIKPTVKTSYAHVTKSGPERALIITQANKNGKDIADKVMDTRGQYIIDPIYSRISDMQVKEGKCVIKSKLDEKGLDQLTKVIKEKVGSGCDIKSPKERKPRLKIVGDFRFDYNEACGVTLDNVTGFIKKQNTFIQVDEIITVVKSGSSKKGDNNYLIIETSPHLYKLMLDVGRITVGFWRCKVYDANIVPRCFKCSSLGHFEKSCTSTDIRCPKCSKDHRLKDCGSNDLNCVNCEMANEGLRKKIDTHHAAYDRNCPTAARQSKFLRSRFDVENG
jgi:hypothetical protein